MSRLRFVASGMTTVTLTDGVNALLTQYRPGDKSDAESVVDKGRVMFLGGLGTIRTTVANLNQLFRQAKIYQEERLGPRVYVERDLGDGVWWRSPVVDALLLPENETLDWMLAAGKLEFDLNFTRLNYWEGAEAQVPLTNGNGTNNTSGLTVHNHDDSGTGHDNYVQIAAASVSGDMSGPARLEITNTYAGSELVKLWIGQSWTNANLITHILEAEFSPYAVNNAGASAGQYLSRSILPGVNALVRQWSLSASQVTQYAGRWFKVLAKFWTFPGQVYFQTILKHTSTSAVLFDSGLMLPDQHSIWQIRELATLQLPPWLQGHAGLDGLDLELRAYHETEGAKDIQIDFVQLTPIDGYRYLHLWGMVAQNQRVVDDAISEDTYIDNGAGSGKTGALTAFGKAIHLEPGKLQRLYFLQNGSTGGQAPIDRTLSVKVFYRPRRRTI